MRWLAAMILCGLIGPSYAAVQTNIGTLTCTLATTGTRDGSPESQTRQMLCSFKPSGHGPEEHYTGEIKNVGSDEALSGKLVLIWVVMGPDQITFGPGLLQQTYAGKLTSSEEGKSRVPAMLVGVDNDSFALRPLDENKADKANTVTVLSLKVKSTPA